MNPLSQRYTSAMLKTGQIVPDRLITPMKFAENVTINGAAGFGSYVFSQNSAYDPDVSSTGGSVVGWTSLSNLYARCRVLASSIKITCQLSDAQVVAVAVAAGLNNTGTGSNAIAVSQFRFARPDAVKILPVSGYGPAVVLRDTCETSEIMGSALYDEDALFSFGNADPVQQFYWTVGANDLLGGAAFGLPLIVELEYVCEWTQPKDLPS